MTSAYPCLKFAQILLVVVVCLADVVVVVVFFLVAVLFGLVVWEVVCSLEVATLTLAATGAVATGHPRATSAS